MSEAPEMRASHLKSNVESHAELGAERDRAIRHAVADVVRTIEEASRVAWLPLGAGDNTHCVRTNGRIFEWITARTQHRPSCDLYHAALELRLHGDRFVIETPGGGGYGRR